MAEQTVPNQPEYTFEEALEKLENIVDHLESGDVPLEKAIELFQEGMRLSQLCNAKLTEVERKIDMLVESEGELVKKPFSAGQED